MIDKITLPRQPGAGTFNPCFFIHTGRLSGAIGLAKLQAPNYTQLPNALIALLPSMSEAETKIAIIIARETFGWHRPKVKLSLTDLMEHTGLTRPAVIKGVKKGIKRGILGRQRAGQGFLYFLIVADEPQQLPDQVVKNLYQSPPAASKKSLPVPVKNLYQQVVKNIDPHKEERKKTKKVKEKHTTQRDKRA